MNHNEKNSNDKSLAQRDRYNTRKSNTNENSRKGNTILSKIIPVLVICAIAVSIILVNQNSNKEKVDTTAKVIDEDLVIQVADISEQVTFYPVTIDGTELEVMALKATDGTIRTAFNTCQICYNSGRGHYEQDGEFLICQNCQNRFGLDDIEVTRGGCNPIPITPEYKEVSEDSIIISKDFLQEATVVFSNWGK